MFHNINYFKIIFIVSNKEHARKIKTCCHFFVSINQIYPNCCWHLFFRTGTNRDIFATASHHPFSPSCRSMLCQKFTKVLHLDALKQILWDVRQKLSGGQRHSLANKNFINLFFVDSNIVFSFHYCFQSLCKNYFNSYSYRCYSAHTYHSDSSPIKKQGYHIKLNNHNYDIDFTHSCISEALRRGYFKVRQDRNDQRS